MGWILMCSVCVRLDLSNFALLCKDWALIFRRCYSSEREWVACSDYNDEGWMLSRFWNRGYSLLPLCVSERFLFPDVKKSWTITLHAKPITWSEGQRSINNGLIMNGAVNKSASVSACANIRVAQQRLVFCISQPYEQDVKKYEIGVRHLAEFFGIQIWDLHAPVQRERERERERREAWSSWGLTHRASVCHAPA